MLVINLYAKNTLKIKSRLNRLAGCIYRDGLPARHPRINQTRCKITLLSKRTSYNSAKTLF